MTSAPTPRRRPLTSGLALVGVLALMVAVYLLLDLPLFVDRLLVVNDEPVQARAIVCIGGGLGDHQIPLPAGWDAIYTAVQLHADGFAPEVIFSGGGRKNLSEAEVYAEAAGWLGLPREAVRLDATPGGTNEHARNLLAASSLGVARDTPILVVTSPLHAKRTELCFRKAGFTRFRMVTSWVATHAGPAVTRDQRRSAVSGYRPSGKRYDDPFNVLQWQVTRLLTSLRELVAIGYYRLRGEI